MNYLHTKLNTFLNESSKQGKIIYHFSESLDSLYEILNGDMLISGSHDSNCRYGRGYDNISFTWNPNLWDIEYLGDSEERYKVRLSFNYDKMCEKWSFKPFDYGIVEEMEEIVETDEMIGISEFITEILISNKESKMEIQNLKEDFPNIKIKAVRRKSFSSL